MAAEGDRNGAIEHFRRSIELFPTAGAWAALGTEYAAKGQTDLALSAFDSALELDSLSRETHYARAVALLAKAPRENGQSARGEAIRSLELTLELFPGHARAALLLARIQLELGRRDAAIRTLERAIRHVDPAQAEFIRLKLDALRRGGDGGAS